MVKMQALSVCVPMTMLAACGVMPSVKYTQLPAPLPGQFGVADEIGLMRYALPTTTLVLDYKKDKNGGDDTSSLELTPVPAESNVTLAVALDDKWGRATTLQWTKVQNSELLATVGTEVTDNRVKVAKAVGETVTGLIGLRTYQATMDLGVPSFLDAEPPANPPAPPVEPFPVAFDPSLFETDQNPREVKLVRGKSEITLKITYGQQQPGSGPFGRMDLTSTLHVLITSACRSITVEIVDGSKFKGRKFTSKFADPKAYQTIPLPQKGTVKLHPVCGADVIANPSTAATDAEVVAAAVAQAKAIKEAWTPAGN